MKSKKKNYQMYNCIGEAVVLVLLLACAGQR